MWSGVLQSAVIVEQNDHTCDQCRKLINFIINVTKKQGLTSAVNEIATMMTFKKRTPIQQVSTLMWLLLN